MQPEFEFLFSLFENLAKTSSRKAKEDLLRNALSGPNAEVLKTALVLANDPYRMFGVIATPEVGDSPCITWDDFVGHLARFESRELTGAAAQQACKNLVSTPDTRWNTWIAKLINKNLQIGAATKTINKVIGSKLIKEFELALCDKIDFSDPELQNLRAYFGDEYFIEPKLDGWRCIAHVTSKGVTFYTRSGKPIANTHYIEAELALLGQAGEYIFDGELLASDFTETEKICSSDQTVLEDELVKRMIFRVFDVVQPLYFISQGAEGACWPLHARKTVLKELLMKLPGNYVLAVPHEDFTGLTTAQYEAHLQAGYEGSILKQKTSVYGFGRTASKWLKVKPVQELDMTAVSFEEGTGKFAGMLGAIVTKGTVMGTEVTVSVGTGLSQAMRQEIWAQREVYAQKTLEVGYQDLTQNTATGAWSLRFPRFRKWKLDR